MKLKLLRMFAGAIATVTIAATSLPAFAQTPSPQPPRPRIVFSQQQEALFEKLKEETVTKIEDLLNAEQKTQFATGRENGEGLGAIKNLSEAQENKIVEILQSFNTQIAAILTPEQKREIEQFQQNQQSQQNKQ
jgi:hypothetical protein